MKNKEDGIEVNLLELEIIFQNYAQKLINEVTLLNSKFSLYNKLNDHIKNNNPSSNTILMLILNSLFTDIIISLSKIYENCDRERSDFDITNFLEFSSKIDEFNIKFFNYYKGSDSISQKIKNHQNEIKELKPILNKLLMWRDKKIAHFDKEPFINDSYLKKEAPLSKEELSKLIDLATKILNTYSFAYSKKLFVTKIDIDYEFKNIIRFLYD